MNQNRMILGLAVAILLALVLSTFVYRKFQQASTVKPVVTQHIVVASAPLQLGTLVDTNNLRLIAWPADEPVTGMFTRIEDCANRALITPVAANELILENKLAPKGSGGGLSATIPEGMRALSVAVNDIVAVAGFVMPGTMVDVLVTAKLSGGGSGGENVTRTILENVRVLAAGQKIAQDREGKPQTVPFSLGPNTIRQRLKEIQTSASDDEKARIQADLADRPGYIPVLLKDYLDWPDMAALEVNTPDLPGVIVEVGASRVYRLAISLGIEATGSHVPHKSLSLVSRRLHAGRRSASRQAPSELCPRPTTGAWFRRRPNAFDTSSTVHSRSSYQRTPDGLSPPFP